jgi:hypothetical protein
VPLRDELLVRLASGAAGAEGIGLGPAVKGADGISGMSSDSGGVVANGIGLGVGDDRVTWVVWGAADGMMPGWSDSEGTSPIVLTCDRGGADGIGADPGSTK